MEPGPAAVADVGRFVRPFATTDPEEPSEDLASLDTVLAGHRLVALGEATHGTREFFQFKHRLIRRMVSHHGSRLLLMEAPWARSRAVDAFLVDGLGTPEKAVAGLGFWTWNVEEFVDLVRWLRAWNRAHPTDQVRFVGIDPQFPPEPGDAAGGGVPGVGPAIIRAQSESMNAARWLWLANLRRDRAMAANALALVRAAQRGPAMLWAHNGHIRRSRFWMGHRLAADMRDQYLVVGLTAHGGRYRAVIPGARGAAALGAVELSAPPPGSLEHVLHEAGAPLAWIDLRALAAGRGEGARWLRRGPRLLSKGAVADSLGSYERVSGQYDILVFVRRSSPSRLLPPIGEAYEAR